MSFWMLEITDEEFNDMPYDKTHMVLVEATSSDEARKLAYEEDSDEMWLDASRTTSTELVQSGVSKVINSFGFGSA